MLPQVVPVIDELRAAGMGEVVDDFADRGVRAQEVTPELAHLWWVSIAQHVADSDRRYGHHDGTGLRQAAHDFAHADRDHLRVTAERVRREVARPARGGGAVGPAPRHHPAGRGRQAGPPQRAARPVFEASTTCSSGSPPAGR